MPNFLKTPSSGIKNVLGQRGPGLSSAPQSKSVQPRLAKTPKGPRTSGTGKMSIRQGTVDGGDPSQVVNSPKYINTQLFSAGGSVPGAKKPLNKPSSGSKVISSKIF